MRAGVECVVLSDRPGPGGMSPASPPIPALLAVGAVHHHLIRAGLRTETSLVADTAQCFTTHHVAMLVGYGAHAVCPYLGFESCRQWRASARTEALVKTGKVRAGGPGPRRGGGAAGPGPCRRRGPAPASGLQALSTRPWRLLPTVLHIQQQAGGPEK